MFIITIISITIIIDEKASFQREPLIYHYLSNAYVLQKWRTMQQIKLAVLDK